MITGGDLRQSRLDVGYKTFTISPWSSISITHPRLLLIDQHIFPEITLMHCREFVVTECG